MTITNDIIQKYLRGDDLDKNTLRAIDEKLHSDEAFAQSIADELPKEEVVDGDLLNVIHSVGEKEAKKTVIATLSSVKDELRREDYFEQEATAKKQSTLAVTHKKHNRVWWAAAASLVLICLGVYFLNQPAITPQQVAQNEFELYQEQVGEGIRKKLNQYQSTLGASASVEATQYKNFLSAIEAFNNKEFEKSAELFKSLIPAGLDDSINPRFYYAVSLLNSNKFDEAIDAFGQIIYGEYADDALFYQAEALLHQNRKMEAVWNLTNLSNSDSDYASEAKTILGKLTRKKYMDFF